MLLDVIEVGVFGRYSHHLDKHPHEWSLYSQEADPAKIPRLFTMLRTQQEIWDAEDGLQLTMLPPWPWMPSLPNSVRQISVVYKHPVRGILLEQPERTETVTAGGCWETNSLFWKLKKRRTISIYPPSPTWILLHGNFKRIRKRERKREVLLFWIIPETDNATETDREHQHSATFSKMMDLGNVYQRPIKLSGGKLVGNFVKGWSELIISEPTGKF